MSRIGKQPVAIPQGVKVQIENGLVRAEGPKGKLSQSLPDGLSAKLENNSSRPATINARNPSDTKS